MRRDGRGIRATTVLLLIIAALSVAAACGAKTEQDEVQAGIYVTEVRVKYDGQLHGVEVKNTQITDEVRYRTGDGEYTTESPKFVLPGRYEVECKVTREGKEYRLIGVVEIERIVLTGISAEDREIVYDGKSHGIEIKGTEEGDEIEYSTDGERYGKEEVELKEIGEYEVYYRVTREYGEYADSVKIKIKRDVRGRYINRTKGVIEIDDKNAEEYEANGETLVKDGEEYKKISDEDSVYKITVNEEGSVYINDKSEITIKITIVEGKAEVTRGDEKIAEIEGANYCTEIDGQEQAYDRTEKELEIRKGKTGKETELTLRLETLPEQEREGEEIKILYDGAGHKFEEAEGVIYRDGNKEHTEVGRYEERTVYVRTGYLPKTTINVMTIMPDMSGVYYTAERIVEIAGAEAKVNGTPAEWEYTEDGWTLNGTKFEGYAKKQAGTYLLGLSINGRYEVIAGESDNVMIVVDGTTVMIGERIYETNTSTPTVKVNNDERPGIPDGSGDLFILGIDDFVDSVAFVEIG